MKHLFLVRSGPFGDNGQLTAEGIQLTKNLGNYIEKTIKDSGAQSIEMFLPQSNSLAEETKDILADILRNTQINDLRVEWLNLSFYKNGKEDKLVAKNLMETLEQSQIVIAVSQFQNLKNLPIMILEKSSNPEKKFEYVAYNFSNFKEKRTILVVLSDNNQVMKILQI